MPGSGIAGGSVTVSNTASASSTGGNAGGFYGYLYLSTDNAITSSDTYLGSRYVSSLAAGSSSAGDTTVTLPTNISGTYYIGAIADGDGRVKESGETNNSRAGDPITVTM